MRRQMPALAWSPDGKSIAFVSARDGNREIYLIQADGRRLTDDRDPAMMTCRYGHPTETDRFRSLRKKLRR